MSYALDDAGDAAWGGEFRALWREARPAGRRRAADLATGVVRLEAVLGPPLRPPPIPVPDPDRWAAGIREDGTFAARGEAAGPSAAHDRAD